MCARRVADAAAQVAAPILVPVPRLRIALMLLVFAATLLVLLLQPVPELRRGCCKMGR